MRSRELISEEIGLRLEGVALSQLGSATRVVIDQDSTTVIGGGEKRAIEARCNELRSQTPRAPSQAERS